MELIGLASERLVVRHLDYCKIGFFLTISNCTVSYVACRVAHFEKSIAQF